MEIKVSKLRGVESFGMICASVEVGLADLFPAAEEHEIMDVTSFDAVAGTPIAKALLGKKKGDVVEVTVPAGVLKFEILDINI